MRKYRGSAEVDPGIYFNVREVEFRSLDERGNLGGAATETWYAVPTPVLLVVAPVVGLAYAIFLPFIGFAMLGSLLAKKLAGFLRAPVEGVKRTLRPAWQPARAFFSRRGRRPRPSPAKETKTDEWAERTREELDDDR